MKIEETRKLFPHLENGMVYLNHAVVSPLSLLIKEEIDKYFDQRSRTNIENYHSMLPISKRAKILLSKILNCEAKNLAWVNNVSLGMNILAQGFPWQPGDRIILNDLEFPSNVYPFMNLKDKGVKVDFVKSNDGIIEIEEIEKIISPKTKMISISQVQFLSGYRADLKSLRKICKENQIIFSVDVIQGVGALRFDVDEIEPDFIAGGTHKWLMGLQGLGYIYVSPKLQEILKPPLAGWLSVVDDWNLTDYNLTFKPNAAKFQIGTTSMISIAALKASLSLFDKIGFKNIEDKILTNTSYLRNKLNEYGFRLLLKNVKPENLSGITTLILKDAEEINQKLNAKNIHCAVREGKLRIAPHFYNTKDEIDILVETLQRIKS